MSTPEIKLDPNGGDVELRITEKYMLKYMYKITVSGRSGNILVGPKWGKSAAGPQIIKLGSPAILQGNTLRIHWGIVEPNGNWQGMSYDAKVEVLQGGTNCQITINNNTSNSFVTQGPMNDEIELPDNQGVFV